MKHQKIILIAVLAAFVLLNTLFIAKELFIFSFISLVLLLGYLLIYRVDMVIYLMAFSTPFSIIISNENVNLGLSLPSEFLMISLTLLFLCRILYDLNVDRQYIKHPVSIAIYLYLLWLLITSVASELPLVSFKFLASKLWFITSSYFVLLQFMKHDLKKWVTFFNCYAFSLAIVVLITTAKSAVVGFGEHQMHWIMKPFYNDHTAYGAILAFFSIIYIGMIFLPNIKKWHRIIYAGFALTFLVGLYFSFSRAAWISFIVAALVWMVVKMRIKFSWLIVGIALLGTLFFYFADDILYRMSRNSQDSSGNLTEQLQSITNISTDASNVERLNRWTAAFGMIKENPVMGWGPGTYQFVYAPFQKPTYKTIITTNFGDGGNAHSEFIGPCAETGFIGLATVLLLMILIIYYGLITYARSRNKQIKVLALSAVLALISYYTHGILNNFLDTDKLSLPFWACFGLIVMLHVLYKRESESVKE